ncbi:MAG: hypothetical protein UT32_C0005G0013 [Parcubacteria group bacterium GW2011_GWC2_39_14]|nr:MAG: hypothetical protein UT32_C0005G0013 [Parcubacteria group bacterium GW2011_GWC2_39_14]KKR54594.1 MAG: hypothetical protein UT91_C0012G0013 [Parcubacteria group bacterium GW2011_GWA2_40_23]
MPLSNIGLAPEQLPGGVQPSEQNLNEDNSGQQVEQQVEVSGGDARVVAGSEAAPITTPVVATPVEPVAVAPVITKSEDLIAIEKILAEGLEDLYKKLPDNRKMEFKQKGEEAASTIEKLMQSAKVHMKKVIGVIRDWLLMIPGVNKFFLEQEIKIKADKLLDYKADKEGQL